LRGILVVAVLVAGASVQPSAQATTVSTAGGVLRVHAPSFGFIQGAVLEQLRDGRALHLELELTVLSAPRGPRVARVVERFSLSFDLWEERFAVTRLGTPARSVTHLKPKAAETWCLEYLSLPLAELGSLGRDAPFWIELSSRVQDAAAAPDREADGTFTLRRLIDLLSERRRDGEPGRTMHAGPFRR
jgi:hypothetical protein